jgi:hypothetical protein
MSNGWDLYKTLFLSLEREDGLCSRLRSLSGAMVMAQVVGKPFEFSWRPSSSCNDRIDRLFEGDWPVVFSQPGGSFRLNGIVPLYPRAQHYHGPVKDLISADDFRLKVNELQRSWQPIDIVRNRLHLVERRFGPLANMAGFHIRRTDMELRRKKGTTLDEWVERVAKVQHITKIEQVYVATCCGEVHQHLRRVYGDKIAFGVEHFDRSAPGDFRQTGMQDALVDLYALAKTATSLGNDTSCFFQHARRISEWHR